MLYEVVVNEVLHRLIIIALPAMIRNSRIPLGSKYQVPVDQKRIISQPINFNSTKKYHFLYMNLMHLMLLNDIALLLL